MPTSQQPRDRAGRFAPSLTGISGPVRPASAPVSLPAHLRAPESPTVPDGPLVTLRDVNGLTRDVAAGDIDAAAHFLTAGQCHSFAVALAERTGWPVVAFWAYDEDDSSHVAHLAVLSPDAMVLDGDPPLPLAVVEERTGWEHSVLGGWGPNVGGPTARERVIALVESEQADGRRWQPLDTDLVASFVDPALGRLDAGR